MKALHIYNVVPKLPQELEALWDLASNLMFEWNHQMADIFSQIDLELWRECRNNPVRFLHLVGQDRLEELAKDTFFLERVTETTSRLKTYVDKPYRFQGKTVRQPVVAYFSAEYGLALCLPIYSGGLGILAGDHLKSCSDLSIPLVGVGLFYRQGYFRQQLSPDGWQEERQLALDPDQMPMRLVRGEEGRPLRFSMAMQGRTLWIQAWEVQVGRIRLLLLDTNVPDNPPDFRDITAQLYGGDLEMRLRQEILLGIGGMRLLHRLNLDPSVIHMNEGHSAFAGVERIREFMSDKGLSFEAALEVVASSSVFTTHTPVPAGNDRFPPDLMERYFSDYVRDLGLAFKVFMALGREHIRDDAEHFCMTVLALRLSRFNNGVSNIHSHVSRSMWADVWPQFPIEDIPIGAVTNGVHIASWVSRDFATFYDRYLGLNWREDPDCDRMWQHAEAIPLMELWRGHERLRERLVSYTRIRLSEQILRAGGRRRDLLLAEEVLDPGALTIGFARRFATYKRADLLLHDTERLVRLVQDQKRPVQFIFAGKAHPRDTEGKKIIQRLLEVCRRPECRNRMVFLEDYDMEVAGHLLQGCDVWLNTPRPPLEACGTSGMKAMANGVLNVSTLDGWWAEAYRPDNSVGWSIGAGEIYEDTSYQDLVESRKLYEILEKDVVPLFYDRDESGMPRGWAQRMKNCLTQLGPVFNSHRMVLEYMEEAYIPAHDSYLRLTENSFQPAAALAQWRLRVMTNWGGIAFRNVTYESLEEVLTGQKIPLRCEVQLGELTPDDVAVESYAGQVSTDGDFLHRTSTPMRPKEKGEDGWWRYEGEMEAEQPGRFGFTLRVLPRNDLLVDAHSLGLIRWASNGTG